MPLLLDTCTFLWLSMDTPKLSEPAKRAIAAHEDDLFVSAIAAFETSAIVRKGRLKLPLLKIEDWFRQAIKHHGIRQVPLNFQIFAKSDQLPPIHGDPMDRILIATAQEYNMTILTPDETIHRYPEVTCLW